MCLPATLKSTNLVVKNHHTMSETTKPSKASETIDKYRNLAQATEIARWSKYRA
jgi:hypothetical protein